LNFIQKKRGARTSLIKVYEILIPNDCVIEEDKKHEKEASSYLYEGFLHATERGGNH
jgi:hypothetical protein